MEKTGCVSEEQEQVATLEDVESGGSGGGRGLGCECPEHLHRPNKNPEQKECLRSHRR